MPKPTPEGKPVRSRTRRTLAAALATAALAALTGTASGAAAPEAAAAAQRHACSPHVSVRGYSDALDKTTYGGVPVAGLSALAQDTDGRIAALSDRSALFSLDIRRHGGTLSPRTAGVVPLADENGAPLDSEGLVVDRRDGSRLVSSETEPSIRRYARDGTLTGRLPVPRMLRVAPEGRARHNQTFEGLTAAGPGRRTLVAAMEGPLEGDGTDARGRPLLRFQSWRNGALSAQWGYPADPGLGAAETAATRDGRLLVLERGYEPGKGNTIRLYLADPRRAHDVRDVRRLTDRTVGRPVGKRLLADLGDCPDLGASHPGDQANPLLDNVEGMAVVGRRVLLVSDDNQSAKQVTRLYELKVRLPHR
ncbi:esterase-like activity of phytase family protein [Streptomyces boncukensis]|uniref:Esterase-like activity of phytase family protein n=1 Tax=Streptomyces boncukensis TaxID=2711219 RepID=A0A6G4WQ87_9ACTN|nr:esterase-like activity of phytase family protein [Streptomyces boncukensis]NGO67365.1 esterase-like activity of phytase family protein [Streptomyces boncukensis]